ncbi:MAG: hypothetical protein QNJ40_06200 [Xanthomonadales bacterium]|nr:hypothetical protein [Xanthomonadales bacterium]
MKTLIPLICAAATLFLTGCSSSTVIRSSDPDARIYVNGEYIGTGDGYYSDKKVAFAGNKVTLRKDGCEPMEYRFRRNEEADLGAIIGGYLFAVPFLWTLEYKDHHAYEFECVDAEQTVR